MIRPFALIAALLLLASASVGIAQDLPSKIRGYKVHTVDVKAGADATGGKHVSVDLGQPSIVNVALTGVTLEATAAISGVDQDGEVDFLAFKDIEANGIALDIEDYQHSFRLRKGEKVVLPFPVRGSVSSLNLAKAVYRESAGSLDRWQVTGTVFVFGRFKKMGLTFKRVIPVPVTLTIDNPIKAMAAVSTPH